MTRPLRGPQNPTAVDHATDTYDTIDWLVKNVPESNGRVGIIGISYDGFLPLMALVNPHPALKVAVPMNPMVDGWIGDDWFHNGAFRQQMMPYIYDQQATRKGRRQWSPTPLRRLRRCTSQAGSAGELGRRRGLEQIGFWRKLARASRLRRVLARPGGGQDARGPAAEGAGDDRPQPLGPGGHLRRARASTRRWSRRTRATTRSSWSWARGTTARRSTTAARSGALRSAATPRCTSAATILRPFLDQYLKDGRAEGRRRRR